MGGWVGLLSRTGTVVVSVSIILEKVNGTGPCGFNTVLFRPFDCGSLPRGDRWLDPAVGEYIARVESECGHFCMLKTQQPRLIIFAGRLTQKSFKYGNLYRI